MIFLASASSKIIDNLKYNPDDIQTQVSSDPVYYNSVACMVGYLAAFYFLWESIRNCIIVYLITFEIILITLTVAIVYR
jgi:hypothetical protein